MICTSGHSWKLQVCNATHLRSIPRCFQCYETLIGKILTVFHVKDSHVPAPCPSASARLAFSNQICPNAPSPQGCPTVCSFCICVLSCDLMRLSLDEFVLNWPERLASALQVYVTCPCGCNEKIFDSGRSLFLVAKPWALLCPLCGHIRMRMRQVRIPRWE